MAGRIPLTLPVATALYDPFNESLTRRTLELEIQELRSEVYRAKTQGDSVGSLAMKRFQFLPLYPSQQQTNNVSAWLGGWGSC
jgi:ribosome modulation factor